VTGALIIGLLSALGKTIRDLRSSEARLVGAKAQLQTVAGELAHRNRNSLFVIMSIVSQSAKDAPSASEAARIINGRLEALLRAQDLLAQSESGAIGLKALVDEALRPFGLERFDIAPRGEVMMATDVGVGLGLLFHELATNAVKHGALASPTGRIFIEWEASDETAHLTWRETGGPPVRQPARRGFGSRLFEVALVPQGGKAERRFEPTGLVCELTIPAPANPSPFLSSVPPGSAFAQSGEDGVLSA
jgi:two-component sensor histidine kinase